MGGTLSLARRLRQRDQQGGFIAHRRVRSGFNLIELMIVLAVTTILTALLLPALSKLHENVNLVRCANNLKQIGMGMFLYTEEWHGQMPPTVKLHHNPDVPIEPQELMASYHTDVHVQQNGSNPTGPSGPIANTTPNSTPFNPPLPEHLRGWDGLGLLHAMDYCRAVSCYYCPSHSGDHPIERYTDEWTSPGEESIYINYHYAGHINWDTRRRRAFKLSSNFIIASDGLRTVSDFNHGTGLNLLFGDGSVVYRNSALALYHMLPEGELAGAYQEELYKSIWFELDRSNAMLFPPNPGGEGGGGN